MFKDTLCIVLQVRPFYEKRMGQEVDAETLGDEFKGYVVRITGGNDKQGFPMKQGILTNQRVRLLLGKGQSCYRPRRDVSKLTGCRIVASNYQYNFRESASVSPSADVLSTVTSPSSTWLSSRRVRVRSPDSLTTPSQEDLDPSVHRRSGSCST